jgi:hypothetical protein
MKHILLSLLLASLSLHAQEAGRRLLISGCGLGYVAIIDGAGKTEWRLPEKQEASDTWLLPDGHILMSYKHGIREIVPDLKSGRGARTVWERPTPKGGETHACQPLPKNRILIGESYQGVSYILEIDREGKEYARVELKGFGGAHNSFRQIRKTPQGTYLVTQQRGGGKALEIDAKGKVIRTFPAGRFVATRLPDGNTLIACGDEHRIIEVDAAGKIVWSVGKNDLDGVSIGFASGLQRLPNGNTLITNWGGHGGSSGAAILEITPAKKIVWQSPSSIANRVSNLYVLDLPNDKIWR